ncbi:MAG: hypothetical protein LBS45_00185 [Synergistaceae bacterium]|jgi:hypothetical protein|nr:hypothetical protein [Synergistaceae bacterium]
MIIAVCIRKCIYEGRLWNVGEKYTGEATPPRHFKPVITPEPEVTPEPEEKKKTKSKETDSK